MIMDPRRRVNEFKFNNDSVSYQNLVNEFNFEEGFLNLRNSMEIPLVPPDPNLSELSPNNLVPSSSVFPTEDSPPEDFDFSNAVFEFISKMLMEEDMEEKSCMFQEALQAAEKPFYEILGEHHPALLDHQPSLYVDSNSVESPDDPFIANYSSYTSSSSTTSSNNAVDSNWVCDSGECKYSQAKTLVTDCSSQSSFNSPTSVVDGLVESPVGAFQVSDLFSESKSICQFRRGVEEASKFLPNGNNLFIDLENNSGFLPLLPKEEAREVVVKLEKKDEREYSPPNESRGRKHMHPLDIDSDEERRNKQSAVYPDQTVRSEMFDVVLLCNVDGSALSTFREALQNEASKNGQSKVSNGGKSRGRKQSGKKEVVDLRTLLIHCAQAVASDDRRSTTELLKQIRQHSSPYGDGSQRLAHYFANGLEARLAGTGSQLYTALANKRTVAAEILKAYHLYLAVCPFKKLTNFFANRTIMSVADEAQTLHIIDFGILYGFQWPCLIQHLSVRSGGPPKLRITGIEFPQPGFRPAERVEETGRRLADYAKSFNVPFEYKAIAQKFETIQIEDLEINRDEFLVVNSMYRFQNLLDETVVVDSPRNAVLNLVKKINPDLYVQGIVNGAYSAPFFVTRFRETLFHFSALFDMLETNAPRESEERMLIEREFFGRECLNVIACEGSERVERPETYKQWQVRNIRAGFTQLPLNQEILKGAKDKVKLNYHKDFVLDEDGRWMLQGWKGRIIYAITAWRPVHDS